MVLKSRFRRARSIRLQKRFLIYNKGARFYSYIDTREQWKKYLGRLCFQMQTPTLSGRAELELLEKEFGSPASGSDDRVRFIDSWFPQTPFFSALKNETRYVNEEGNGVGNGVGLGTSPECKSMHQTGGQLEYSIGSRCEEGK